MASRAARAARVKRRARQDRRVIRRHGPVVVACAALLTPRSELDYWGGRPLDPDPKGPIVIHRLRDVLNIALATALTEFQA